MSREAAADGEVQREPMVLVAAHAPVERARVLGDDRADPLLQPERERGEDVVARAAAHEELRDLRLRGLPAGRPADHAERMVVAFAVDVTAGVDEQPDDLEVSGRRRPMQCVCVVFGLARVDVGAIAQQRFDRAGVPGLRRLEQGHLG